MKRPKINEKEAGVSIYFLKNSNIYCRANFFFRSSQLKGEERGRGGEVDYVRSILGDRAAAADSGSRFGTLSRLEGNRDDNFWARKNDSDIFWDEQHKTFKSYQRMAPYGRQCDHMGRLFPQYLAIYCYGNSPNTIKILA